MGKSSTSCRRCRRWLEGEWNVAETDEGRKNLQREMDQGYCDICLPTQTEKTAGALMTALSGGDLSGFDEETRKGALAVAENLIKALEEPTS